MNIPKHWENDMHEEYSENEVRWPVVIGFGIALLGSAATSAATIYALLYVWALFSR